MASPDFGFPDPTNGNTFDQTAAANAVGKVFAALMGQQAPTSTVGAADPFLNVTSAQQSQTTGTTSSSATTQGARPDSGLPISEGYGVNGHPGVDIAVPVGTPLLAALPGRVTVASLADPNGYGNEVEIQTADGTSIRYGHLSSIGVKVGDTVSPGQLIGASGGQAGAPGSGNATGPHLHFEVRQGGHSIDPAPFLAANDPIIGTGGAGGTPVAPTTAPAPSVTTMPTPDQAAPTAVLKVGEALGANVHSESDNSAQTTSSQTGGTTTGGAGDNDPGAVDSFLAAIRQHESGGNYTIRNQSGQSNAAGAYQFLGSTWRGLGGSTASAADASPAEQDAIARRYAMQLFNEFGSWRLAAIAWFGGPGVAQQAAQGHDPGSPQGQGGYLAYGDTISRMMQGASGG